MIFIASFDGSIKAVLPSTVNQGSNIASRIILIGPFLASNRVKCAFRLPNGMVSGYEEANPIEMTQLDLSNTELGLNYTAWYYDLQDFVTAIKGTVSVQFTIYNGTQKITTTAQDFQVLRGVDNLEPVITTDEYNQIENAFSVINANIDAINIAIEELNLKTSILKTDRGVNEFLAGDGNYKEVPIPQSVTDSISSLVEEVEAKADKVTVDNQLAEKVDKSQVATVNGQSLLEGGDIQIQGDSGSNVVVDAELSIASENPVQNKVITEALNSKVKYPTNKDQVKWGTGPYLVAINRTGNDDGTITYTESFRITNPVFIYDLAANPIPAYKEAGRPFSSQSNETLAKLKHTIFIADCNDNSLRYEAVNKGYVDDKFSVFSPLHHFVIVPPDYDWTFNFYMVLPNKLEAFNTLAEFLDYISALPPINNVKYFGGLNCEMNLDPSGVTNLKFELDEQALNIIGINLDGYIIPKDTIESETGETQFMFSDTVIA